MTAGRPPKPTEQKRRTGTLRPGRTMNAGKALAVVPAASAEVRDLTPADAFERVLTEGVHWLGQTDGPMLALAREALEDLAKARAVGDLKLTIAAREQVMKMFGVLGFDPAARSRLGLAEVKAQSKVEEIIALRQKRTPN